MDIIDKMYLAGIATGVLLGAMIMVVIPLLFDFRKRVLQKNKTETQSKTQKEVEGRGSEFVSKNLEFHNPLSFIKSIDEVPAFVEKFVKECFKDYDKTITLNDELKNAQNALLRAIVYFLLTQVPATDRNFAGIARLIKTSSLDEVVFAIAENWECKSTLDIIFYELEKEKPDHIAVKEYAVFKKLDLRDGNRVVYNIKCNLIDLGWISLSQTNIK